MTGWVKLVGAVLLLSCFALPMSSCTQHRSATGQLLLPGADGSYPAGTVAVKTRYYLLEQIKASEPVSWLQVAALIWPAILLIHARYRPSTRLGSVLWFMEPLLLGGSVFMIIVASILNTPDIGSYVGWAGIAIYFCGWVIEAWSKGRTWMRKRSLTNHSNDDAPKDGARFS